MGLWSSQPAQDVSRRYSTHVASNVAARQRANLRPPRPILPLPHGEYISEVMHVTNLKYNEFFPFVLLPYVPSSRCFSITVVRFAVRFRVCLLQQKGFRQAFMVMVINLWNKRLPTSPETSLIRCCQLHGTGRDANTFKMKTRSIHFDSACKSRQLISYNSACTSFP